MRIEKTDKGVIYFFVEEEYLKKYGLELETFRDKKPFPMDIFDDLLSRAVKEYGAAFRDNAVPKSIRVLGNIVIFEVEEMANIYSLFIYFFEGYIIFR